MPVLLPISGLIGTIAGVITGHATKQVLSNTSLSEGAKDTLATVAHWAGSSVVGSAVSNIIDPVTTVVHPMTTAVGTALAHKDLIDFAHGKGLLPSLRQRAL